MFSKRDSHSSLQGEKSSEGQNWEWENWPGFEDTNLGKNKNSSIIEFEGTKSPTILLPRVVDETQGDLVETQQEIEAIVEMRKERDNAEIYMEHSTPQTLVPNDLLLRIFLRYNL